MHAAARGEVGSGGTGAGELADGEKAGVVLGNGDGLGRGAGLTALSVGEETPCGLPSSFFHMRHLDVEK